MITTRPSNAASSEAGQITPSPALPRFTRLAGAGCLGGALPIALLLLTGRTWLAVSVALGVGISLGVCGLLFLFVERVMPVIFGAARSHGGPLSTQGTQLQFFFLLGAKLAFIVLVGAAFLTLRQVNPIGVIIGFALGQGAIVVSAIRFRKAD
jgi:hypothetical protein